MRIDGACHCGQFTYRAEVDEGQVMICHCADCQVLSGSAYRTVAVAPAETFEILSGTLKDYVKVADSGNRRAIGFCPSCGSNIYATAAVPADRVAYNLRVGTIRQRAQLTPAKQIWCRSALDWVQDIHALPRTD